MPMLSVKRLIACPMYWVSTASAVVGALLIADTPGAPHMSVLAHSNLTLDALGLLMALSGVMSFAGRFIALRMPSRGWHTEQLGWAMLAVLWVTFALLALPFGPPVSVVTSFFIGFASVAQFFRSLRAETRARQAIRDAGGVA